MMVLALERVSPSLRGELTRWMLEVRPGVFVGQPSAMVRDRLWQQVCTQLEQVKAVQERSAAVLLHTTDNEQGYAIRYMGEPTRRLRDFDGLQLIMGP
jgi:CRISPR-associated protein Cas2